MQQRLGLVFEGTERLRLTTTLQRRIPATGAGDLQRYLASLEGNSAELDVLADELTIGETYFLRQPEQFTALVRTVLPQRMADRDDQRGQTGPNPPAGRNADADEADRRRPLQLLSAGCSRGEEAYSLAIALAENGYHDHRITGLDVNPRAVEKARRGRYTGWSMRDVPVAQLQRWFTTTAEGEFEVSAELRHSVDFVRHNLTDGDPAFWQPRFDVIFCRNVLMYFDTPTARRVVTRLARSLLPGGFLFLGSAEVLRGISEEFELCADGKVFYYRLARTGPDLARPQRTGASGTAAGIRPGGSNTHRTAVPRVTAPGGPVHLGGRPRHSTPTAPRAEDEGAFTLALELLRSERFRAALETIGQIDLPTTAVRSAWDREVVLTRAVLLTHTGDATTAAADAHRLLVLDPDSTAEAHAVLATCREAEGVLSPALSHWRAAVATDPAFGIAHLRAGMLLRQTGRSWEAEDAYRRAATALPGETDRRILLFGGGFGRDALLSLCRSTTSRSLL